LLIVVTNQAGIGRGYFTEDDFFKVNQFMLDAFLKQGIPITDVFFCPFHLEGIGEYRKDSFDRKPNPGMIIKAANKHDIDLSQSVLIGDKDSDIEAGRRAGVGRLIALKGKYPISASSDVVVCKGFGEILHLHA
jgi:D-glycero-D-manno-heptose 1,7-bisphosphate phosphatase